MATVNFEAMRSEIAAKLNTLKTPDVQIPTVISEVASIIAEKSEIVVET